MNATFPTALLLVLVLLIQSATAVAATLPCTPEGMAAPASAQMSHGISPEMSHLAHSMDHHPDAHPVQSDKQTDKLTATNDRPDCCEQMNTGVCAAGGCAAGTGSTMTMPLLAPYLATDLADRLRPVDNTSHYPSPSSAIFRPPIS